MYFKLLQIYLNVTHFSPAVTCYNIKLRSQDWLQDKFSETESNIKLQSLDVSLLDGSKVDQTWVHLPTWKTIFMAVKNISLHIKKIKLPHLVQKSFKSYVVPKTHDDN